MENLISRWYKIYVVDFTLKPKHLDPLHWTTGERKDPSSLLTELQNKGIIQLGPLANGF